MDKEELDKGVSSEETSQLNRNRSFKSKQLVRSQAIRESQSPPRTVSPSVAVGPVEDVETFTDGPKPDVTEQEDLAAQCDVPSGVYRAQEDDRSDCVEDHKKQQVEIQITSGQWDEPQSEQRQRTKRWLGHRQHSRDLLSNNPRVACVCGACCNNACPHCRGRRRRHTCPTKQDSGIVCSDECPDCSDSEPNGEGRKSASLDVDDQTHFCRCPERKEKPKSISLSRTDSEEKSDPSGPELVNFLKETLNKNARDRMTLLKIEKELHALVSDPGRCIVRFPVMTSYGRMLVHRCAALFQLCHHLDHTNKTCVLVSKSGTSGGRIPCTSFKAWCTAVFPAAAPRAPPDPTHAKSILKRDTHSLDEAGAGALSASRSKSLEQREREYERVRRRIFSSDNCSQDESQWQWLNSGPIKLLTPADGGRNKLTKVQSLEGPASGSASGSRGAVSKSHSFGGYGRQPDPPRLLSRQGDLASSSWRLSPSSSGYRTLSLHSTDSVTPSPTGGASPEPGVGGVGGVGAEVGVMWAITDLSAVPPGALVIHPQTGRPLSNPDGSVYHFDPSNPPLLDRIYVRPDTHIDLNCEKKRGRLEKQHSFIDSECECRPSDDGRNKCCCECRRHEPCQKNSVDKVATQTEQKQHQKPASPCKTRYEAPPDSTNQNAVPEPQANHRQAYEPPANQTPVEVSANQRSPYEATSYNASPNPRPVYEAHRYEPVNQKERFESQRSFETNHKFELANQRPPSELANQRPVQLTNHGTPEMQYIAQQYPHGYSHEEMTSPPQPAPAYVTPEMAQAMAQQMKPMQLSDPNMRPMSLGVVYGGVQYPFPVYPMLEDHKQLPPAPHTDNTFRIDPSYPYAALEYSGCGACSPRGRYLPAPAAAAAPAAAPPPALHHDPPALYQTHYPYGDGLQWAGVGPPVGAAPKLFVPELWYNVPAVYPHYNFVYPQVMPQSYQVCQPAYPPAERGEVRRASVQHSKRNSISGSARNTPLQTTPDDKKVPYDEPQNLPHLQNLPRTPQNCPPPNIPPPNIPSANIPPQNAGQKDPNEIATKIQQIKDQMAGINVREKDGNSRGREERGRRNSGHGILGSYPHAQYNGRFLGRPTNDETQLSSAARAIVNSIRNMQAKNNNFHQDRRGEFSHNNQYRGEKEREWRRRDDKDREREQDRRPPLHYPRDYLLRQMSPGTWCRRSPGPIHPVLNPPRRPHPDTRNPRR